MTTATLEPATPPQPKTKIWIEHGYALLASHPNTDYFLGANAAFLTGDASLRSRPMAVTAT